MWVRGLKPSGHPNSKQVPFVAPYVGAWIETAISRLMYNNVNNVAPYVGAWIETYLFVLGYETLQSHPMWVRGLKLNILLDSLRYVESHPMWVRGLKQIQVHRTLVVVCRTLCGCVD